MSLNNPTRLRIGMHAEFAGKDFRLVGRVVMGVEVDGEEFFWNEFNLQAKTGEQATLVFDESEGGGTWRLFTEFEPQNLLTAAEAVQKQVGDTVNLTGADVPVTWVGSSRVHRVEGIAPKGLKVGSEDNYFNADWRGTMLVVSWIGREVEYYQGISLTSQAVATAFNLTGIDPAVRRLPYNFKGMKLDGGSFWSDSENQSGTGQLIGVVIVALFFVIMFLWDNFYWQSSYEAPPSKMIAAPALPLPTGVEGRWQGEKFRITAHAVMEIAQPGVIFQRHEYTLADFSGRERLLVCGDSPQSKDWTLYTPLTPLLPPTPQQAAAKKVGEVENVDGVTATITDLFQSTVRAADAPENNVATIGDVKFGHRGSAGTSTLMLRWNQAGIQSYQGRAVSPKEFANAFSKR